VSIKNPTANSLEPAQRFVAGNARFNPGRFSHHAFHPACFEVHQVARSENTGVAHSSGYVVDLAVSKDLAAFHRYILAQRCLLRSGGSLVASSNIRQRLGMAALGV